MFEIIDDFENQSFDIKYKTIKMSSGKSIKVYQIEDAHKLIQFIGYAKYKNKEKGNVYYRGQTNLYDGTMVPSCYRGKSNYDLITNNLNAITNTIIRNNKSFKDYDKNILVPILQHYGIKTNWIDLVDNIWVALWFALHETKARTIDKRDYILYQDTKQDFAYIVLMGSDAKKESSVGGIYNGKGTTLVDLRKATPSFYLRPHAQHAYMIKRKNGKIYDYSDLIVGIARIPTELGFKWLGENTFLTVNCLFPSVHYDTGYQLLLRKIPETPGYGSIQILSD